MDVTFNCPSCKQQLAADVALAGSQIPCPTCNTPIGVPEATAVNIKPNHATHREEHHFSVPVHDAPSEVLVRMPSHVEEEVKSDGKEKLKVKTFRRSDCIEVGRDRFDETVSEFLTKVGQNNLVSLTPVNYSHIDLATRQLMNDFGVIIAYRG